MKKVIALALLILTGMVALPATALAQTRDRVVIVQDNDRDYRQTRRNRRGIRRNDNYGYEVRNEQRYVRVGRRVYREVYRSTYRRNGQLVSRQLISRERVNRYDRYNDNDFRRETGSGFGIYFRF